MNLAATHSLSDMSTLPWWAQLIIGVGLLAVAAGLSWWATKREACFPALGSIAVGIAGLITIWRALFG